MALCSCCRSAKPCDLPGLDSSDKSKTQGGNQIGSGQSLAGRWKVCPKEWGPRRWRWLAAGLLLTGQCLEASNAYPPCDHCSFQAANKHHHHSPSLTPTFCGFSLSRVYCTHCERRREERSELPERPTVWGTTSARGLFSCFTAGSPALVQETPFSL